MVLSSFAGKKCPHGEYIQDMCLDHRPDWDWVVGNERREPNPGIFGKKTFWARRHCGRPMARYKVVRTKRCRKCGRTEDHIAIHALALCLCCGYHFDNTPYSD